MFHPYFELQVTWLNTMRWIKARGLLRLDHVDAESTGSPSNTGALNRDLSDNFNDSSVDTWTHHYHPMKIQRKRSIDASLLSVTWTHLNPSSPIELTQLNRTVLIKRCFIWIVDRDGLLDPTITPNYLINRTVLHDGRAPLDF